MRQQAEVFEKQADWDKACDVYEAILRLRRDLPEVKERYVYCVRRLWQSRRHHDYTYRKEVLSIEYGQAVHLYNVVRDLLLDFSLERKKLTPAKLFRKGLEELDCALADPFFCREHVPPDRLAKVEEFRAILQKTWGNAAPANRKEALKHVCEVALAAQSFLRLSSTVVVMEFACGSCYALDDYTVYLTPAQLRELCSSLRGETVGVGVEIEDQSGRVMIQKVEGFGRVAEDEEMLRQGDEILSIDKKAVAMLPIDTVRSMLDGPAGTVVEVEILSPAMERRIVHLRRQAVPLPSVSADMLPDSSTGYLRIDTFQESTPKEVDDALAGLAARGMKSLIVDLRGNGGGLFEAAVDVARRFLPSGVIATKQHLDDKSGIVTTVCEAKNPNAWTLPMVVLIDNDTASSAEVLAGALKENNRATLVGQLTFGKGCTQFLLKLPDFKGGLPAGGMRLTVAKVYSPKGLPYTGRGVVPDIVVDRPVVPANPSIPTPDAQVTAAQIEVQRLLALAPR
jgi:carboxyl-terminal processing protease